jgi:hypothetical protein
VDWCPMGFRASWRWREGLACGLCSHWERRFQESCTHAGQMH